MIAPYNDDGELTPGARNLTETKYKYVQLPVYGKFVVRRRLSKWLILPV
jgi:hypothetical protein